MPISMRHRLPGLTSGGVFGSGRELRPPNAIHPGDAADQRRLAPTVLAAPPHRGCIGSCLERATWGLTLQTQHGDHSPADSVTTGSAFAADRIAIATADIPRQSRPR